MFLFFQAEKTIERPVPEVAIDSPHLDDLVVTVQVRLDTHLTTCARGGRACNGEFFGLI